MNGSEPNPLRDHLDRLPREIPPARDLWPEIQAQVEPLGHRTTSPSEAAASKSTRRAILRFRLPLAIAAALALAATLHWLRPSRASWAVDALAGTPRIDRMGVTGPAQIAVGEWLETDAASRAKVTVGTIGEVNVEPNSRLRLVSASATDHRLQLERGRMSALIWAPPRLFFVETPAATAIDLGCAYTLAVDDRGVGVLEVTSGYVALEHGDRQAIVPAGLVCLTQPGIGPGTPFSTLASVEFRAALNRFDAGDSAALPEVLGRAGATDAVSLWHLLARVTAKSRGGVFDKLAQLQSPPGNVTRDGIVAGDRIMRERWALTLGLWPVAPSKKKF